MRLFFKLLSESILFALNALVVNKLRTFLSLLGVTIGIFAIISVFTMVDSMEQNIQGSIESLGDNVVFVQKWPWAFGGDYPWWKYVNRPVPTLKDLAEINKYCETAEASAFMLDVNRNVEFGNSVLEGATIILTSHDYNKVRNFEIAEGRYFTEAESTEGNAVAIIGAEVALQLFPNLNPIEKMVKIDKHKFQIIGIFKKEGESIIDNSLDYTVIIPVNFSVKSIDLKNKRLETMIMVKAKEGISNAELKDELTGVLRSSRKLKPLAEDDFALNETSLLSQGIEDLFGTVNWAGGIIGLFSILVGGFGIANIMFVSVKERTNQIGIQKSLGAKNNFILFQFLSEAIILCLIGGIVGLVLIYSGTLIVQSVFEINVFLSLYNIVLGLVVSAVIGLISGIIPAWSASRLDPVEAIRQ